MFFLGEFLEIVTSSAIMITLFFGGWHMGSTIDGFMFQHLPNVAFVAAMATCWLVQGLRLLLVPALDSLVAAALPFGPAHAARVAAPLPISIANVVATAVMILWAQSSS